MSSDAQTDAHGALNADGAAEHLAEAVGATEHAASGVSQPTADQVAYVSKIMGEYRKEDWLDDEERWKREMAQETLEAKWHKFEIIEQPGAGAKEQRQLYTFDLRWALSGEIIKNCVEPNDVDIERLLQDLDEGYLEEYGAPHAKDVDGWYRIFYGDVELECGRTFSDYGIPHNATITVVQVRTMESSGS